jgi:hypothetical protein
MAPFLPIRMLLALLPLEFSETQPMLAAQLATLSVAMLLMMSPLANLMECGRPSLSSALLTPVKIASPLPAMVTSSHTLPTHTATLLFSAAMMVTLSVATTRLLA